MSDSVKRERFERLATLRTKAVLEKLRILGHCTNRSAYEYNDKDIKKIFDAIEEELELIRNKFKAECSKNREFKL